MYVHTPYVLAYPLAMYHVNRGRGQADVFYSVEIATKFSELLPWTLDPGHTSAPVPVAQPPFCPCAEQWDGEGTFTPYHASATMCHRAFAELS